MTADEFRAIALSLPEAVEIGHMGHPDFRVGKKIFATLGYPDDDHGMVKLMPDQQALFIGEIPGGFLAVERQMGSGRQHARALPSAKPKRCVRR